MDAAVLTHKEKRWAFQKGEVKVSREIPIVDSGLFAYLIQQIMDSHRRFVEKAVS